MLADLNRIPGEAAVIGTSIRVNALDVTETGFTLSGCGADCDARMRLRLPQPLKAVRCAITEAGGDGAAQDTPIAFAWDESSATVLLSFCNRAGKTVITGQF